jgi:hypothetical protein
MEGMFVKELNATEGNGASTTRVVLDIFDIKEILAEFFFRDLIGRFKEMFGQLTDGSDIHLLGAFRETSELKVLDHTFLKFCHSITSLLLNGNELKKY